MKYSLFPCSEETELSKPSCFASNLTRPAFFFVTYLLPVFVNHCAQALCVCILLLKEAMASLQLTTVTPTSYLLQVALQPNERTPKFRKSVIGQLSFPS